MPNRENRNGEAAEMEAARLKEQETEAARLKGQETRRRNYEKENGEAAPCSSCGRGAAIEAET